MRSASEASTEWMMLLRRQRGRFFGGVKKGVDYAGCEGYTGIADILFRLTP